MQFRDVERAMLPAIIRRALFKRFNRRRIDAIYERTLATMDRAAIRDLAARYPTEGGDIGPNKYLTLDWWLRESVVRALRLDLDRSPPLRVLDMGSGTGYFLHACRILGHDARGIDLDCTAVFNEMMALLGIPRATHFVTPENPLPPGDETYDLVTAYMITFNGVESDHEWDRDEWATFLDNLLPRIAPGGRACMTFNYSARRRMFYDTQTARLFEHLPGCRTRRRGDELLIVRLPGR